MNSRTAKMLKTYSAISNLSFKKLKTNWVKIPAVQRKAVRDKIEAFNKSRKGWHDETAPLADS